MTSVRLSVRRVLPRGLCTLIALFATVSALHAEPVTVIRNNGPSANRVDLVVVGDGYTAAEIASGKYATDVESFVVGVFAQQPYLEYQHYFNVTRIDVTSADSGVDHPEVGVFKNTALDSYYNCGNIQRLICTDTTKVNAVLNNSGIAANAREMILVLVNDTEYGGSGGSIAVASINGAVVELVLHEVGHSFAQLADEYGGPPPPACGTTEPSAANATRQTVRASIKWNVWIDPATPVPTTSTANGIPGLFQGAVYCDTTAYRPTFNSKMRSLNQPFHQINEEQHIRRIYNFVSPIDGSSPAGSVIASGASQAFSVALTQPMTPTLSVTWRVDGVVQGTGTAFTATGLTTGPHTVTATVVDTTAKVRNDPTGLLVEVRTWTLNTTAPPGPFAKAGPAHGAVITSGSATLSWQASIGATAYEYCIDTANNNTCDASWVPTGATTSALVSGFTPGTTYFWQVRASNSEGVTLADAGSWWSVSRQVLGGVNLIQNGTFDTGTTAHWLLFSEPTPGDMVSNVSGGVFQFYRTGTQAVIFQQTGQPIAASTPLVAQFQIGNSSSARKRVSVLIHDSSFNDLSVCTFWLPPNTPLSTYAMQTHTTRVWANATISFYAASTDTDGGFYRLDNVSMSYAPGQSATETRCVDPFAPVAPSGVNSGNLLVNGDFSSGELAPGWGTFGTVTANVTGGVLQFMRPTADPPSGVVLQLTGQAMSANQIVTATFALGNSSNVRKRVTVLLHDQDFSDLSACTFWLAPNQALATYTYRTYATEAWANAMLSIYPATVGAEQWILLDDATLAQTAATTIGGTECIEPATAGDATVRLVTSFAGRRD